MEPAIKKAESKLEHLSSDEETMSMYYAREKSLHDQANMIYSAEQRKALDIARRLKSKGLDVVEIHDITGLSELEIINL